MTQSNDLSNRVERLENDNIDIKLAVSALIETVNRHQTNFETSQRNFETTQRNIEVIFSEIREIRSEIKGLQTENRRLMDRLFGPEDPED